jgi:hypothetical protein
MIETCVESDCATERIRSTVMGHLFIYLVRTVRSCVHIIKLPNPISKLAILKLVILIDSEIESMF